MLKVKIKYPSFLNPVSTRVFYFTERKPLNNYGTYFLFHLKRPCGSWEIQVFVIFLLDEDFTRCLYVQFKWQSKS